jgi:hypothetical protein
LWTYWSKNGTLHQKKIADEIQPSKDDISIDDIEEKPLILTSKLTNKIEG